MWHIQNIVSRKISEQLRELILHGKKGAQEGVAYAYLGVAPGKKRLFYSCPRGRRDSTAAESKVVEVRV